MVEGELEPFQPFRVQNNVAEIPYLVFLACPWHGSRDCLSLLLPSGSFQVYLCAPSPVHAALHSFLDSLPGRESRVTPGTCLRTFNLHVIKGSYPEPHLQRRDTASAAVLEVQSPCSSCILTTACSSCT